MNNSFIKVGYRIINIAHIIDIWVQETFIDEDTNEQAPKRAHITTTETDWEYINDLTATAQKHVVIKLVGAEAEAFLLALKDIDLVWDADNCQRWTSEATP